MLCGALQLCEKSWKTSGRLVHERDTRSHSRLLYLKMKTEDVVAV
jgi:hypothetical protein